MVIVIKKDGKKQAFNSSKIKQSIKKAARESKVPSSKYKEILREITGFVIKRFKRKKYVKTTEIRKAILKKLDVKAKFISSAWRRYDKKRRA